MAYQSQDIIRRSATNGFTPAPQARDHQQEVAKLIDVTTCIGCKACQVACSEWNDIRDEVGHNVGVYDNPADLTAKSWTVMRFSEVEQNDKLEWLIRKDGCMHCADPGCLKACPSEGAIIQYANGIVDFQSEQCIGCGYCIAGCPFDVPRLSPEDNRVYKCTLCVDRVTVGQEPACVKTCPTGAIHFGSKEDMKTLAGERVAELKTRGYDNAGLYDPAASVAPTSCTCCTMPTSRICTTACRKTRRSARPSSSGKASGNRWRPSASPRPSQPVSSTTSASVRTARKRKRTICMKRKTRCANEKT